jgi:hypothetical protein
MQASPRAAACPRDLRLRRLAPLAVVITPGISLSGYAQEKVDPLEVADSATVVDITEITDTGFCTVDCAVLNATSFDTESTSVSRRSTATVSTSARSSRSRSMKAVS